MGFENPVLVLLTTALAGLAIGVLVGAALKDRAWRENADRPMRMLGHDGRFYKVSRRD